MGEVLNVQTVVFPLQDTANGWQGNDKTGHIFSAPSDTLGGGITIVGAYAVNAAATTSGTAFSLQLENWGTAGTAIKATAGTVAAAIGGTADVFAAGTPKAFTISNAFVDAGEYIVLRKSETNSSDPTRGVVVIQYLMGK